jgi:Ca-activated chloride channel family protein
VGRPRLDFTFLLDASATMYHFKLDPVQRAQWLQRARTRGDVQEQVVDGRTAMVWGGQTLRDLSNQVSTPMHSALRGLWRGLTALEPTDPIGVIAFADHATLCLDDAGHPNLAERRAVAQHSLARLTSGTLGSGMGHNTRLAQALRLAFERLDRSPDPNALHRAVLVSDGQVEDREACLPLLEEALERDLVISAIGVGDEFDEEFLMRVADQTRGRYTYAPTARDLEEALVEEFAVMSTALARQATLRIEPNAAVVFHELYQTSPVMARFPVVWVNETGTLYRLGNLPGGAEIQLAASFGLPGFPEGEASLATVTFQGLPLDGGPPVEAVSEVPVLVSGDALLAAPQDDRVMDVVRRLEVFLEERAAQAARERGDPESATRHLRAATRMLRGLGQDALAAEMEAEAEAVGAKGRDQSRTKRIKSGTRRLGGTPAAPPPPPAAADLAGTRRLASLRTPDEPEAARRPSAAPAPAPPVDHEPTRRLGPRRDG